MKYLFYNLFFIIFALFVNNFGNVEANQESVLAIILSKNEELYLPYFLSFFQRLTYPKNKISLFIRSGKNTDRTKEILNAWLRENLIKYHSINLNLDDDKFELGTLAEEALMEARRKKFDYVWFLNQKAVITNKNVLQSIMEENLLVAAPMVQSISSYFSNFWGKFSKNWEYERSHDYIDIVQRKKRGCYEVPLLHSLFLINLRIENENFLTFNKSLLENFDGPSYFQIIFSASAKQNGAYLHICNKDAYGLVTTPFREELKDIMEIKTYLHQNKIPFNISEELLPFMPFPKSGSFGFDKTYVINLVRQPIRQQIMKERLKEIGIEPTFYKSVDGENLNETYLSSIGYKPHVNYTEKYLTTGAIGCGLTHYFLWEEAIELNYSKVLILEDDAEFEEDFGEKLKSMLKEVEELNLSWDLIYLCRENVFRVGDTPVNNSEHLLSLNSNNVRTTGYILSHSGLRKLHQQEFISNMVPVDLYLSLKFWDFENRYIDKNNGLLNFTVNMKAFSIHPLIIKHTKYGNTESDTDYTPQHHEIFGQFAKNDLKILNSVSKDEL